MTSIGIEYSAGHWKTCLAENGQFQEFFIFKDAHATFSYVNQLSTERPEVLIALSSPQEAPLLPLDDAIHAQLVGGNELSDVQDFLRAIVAARLKGYLLPAVKYLPQVPRYRRLKYPSLGTAERLCSATTLLYRMRQQDAPWSEMQFFSLEIGAVSHSITVIKDGYIVDGIGEVSIGYAEAVDEEDRAQAFWERLIQDLASLVALYQVQDIVIKDWNAATRKQTVIERLGETYQFYLFPRVESEPEGFEGAIGASILAEGLSGRGLSAEVAARLLSVVPHL
jgi:predicted butyrate kinase (DUF1464 family)